VIMPLRGQDMDDAYSAIKQECSKLAPHARHADEDEGSGFVIREIVDLTGRAEFIICNLTHEKPHVYYELGYAHGAGNEVMDILLIA